jgi:hypothetical protein
VAGEPGFRVLAGESGQALVEFALIAPLFLLIVLGIIQFGLAVNNWLDLQRIANQGARWGAVNAYPGCPDPVSPDTPCSETLEEYLASEPVSGALNPDVEVCFEQMSEPTGATIGDPVTVKLTSQFQFVPIVGLGELDLDAVATMRIERLPTHYTAGSC